MGIKQFNYPVASCFEVIRGVLSNSITTNAYNRFTQVLPFSTRYLLLSLSDGCRVLLIKNKISNPNVRELMCPSLSKLDCMKEVIVETNQNSSYTITGKIFIIAVSALFSFEEKEKYQIKDHPLVNEEIRERGDILMALNASAALLDMLSLIDSIFITDKGVSGLFDDFPNEEINKISANLKEKLKVVMKEDIKSKDDLTLYKMAVGMETKYDKIAEGVNSRIIDAYMIKLVDEELSYKLDKTSCSGVSKFYKGIFKKLPSDKYKKNLTVEELEKFKNKFEMFNKRRKVCNDLEK